MQKLSRTSPTFPKVSQYAFQDEAALAEVVWKSVCLPLVQRVAIQDMAGLSMHSHASSRPDQS